jgi:hypothetical protein
VGASDVWAAVKELRQILVDLPMATAAAAIKQHEPVPLPWETHPLDPGNLLKLREQLTTLLDRLAAVGAIAQLLIDGEPFDRVSLQGRFARAEAEVFAGDCTRSADGDLYRIVNNERHTLTDQLAARKELASRLHNVDAKELLWTADSLLAPPLRRTLARVELERRGIAPATLREEAGCCPHPRWEATSDSYHECAYCCVTGKHDWKGAEGRDPYGHGCSVCGYFEDD